MRRNEAAAPNRIPIRRESTVSSKKSKTIKKPVPAVISFVELSKTALKIMIVTMSFKKLSPQSTL